MPGRLPMALCAAAVATVVAAPALAKDIGVHSPSGRQIYEPHEQFGEVIDQTTRRLVVEVATGAGPEGNLGILLGLLNFPLRGVELYAGIGFEANPARHYTGTIRFYPDFGSFRPYVAAGYLFNDTFEIGVTSHNLFGEIGHKWVIHRTYHLTAGLGLRRLLSVQIDKTSILNDPDVDQELLDEQIDEVMPRWLPTIALRFSRAF